MSTNFANAPASPRLPLATAVLTAMAWVSGCATPECATPKYDEPECRVIAENEHARLQTSTGVEVRFLPAGARNLDPWDATGLVTAGPNGTVNARVAGLGSFTLALHRRPDGPDTLTLRLSNVDANAVVTVGPNAAATQLDPPPPGQTWRTIEVPLSDEPTFVEGILPCPSTYRLAVVSDIQTNPDQFRRIVQALGEEWRSEAAASEPLVGLVIPGDITDASRDEEFAQIHEILAGLPFPTAVTPGNHDIYRPDRPYFTRNFGPGNHEFTVCQTHVAMLDSGNGSLAASVRARLPELLDAGEAQFSLVGVHHPPYAGWTGSGWSREDQAAHLLTKDAIAGVDLVLAGHSHSLVEFPDVPVGDTTIREIIAGTAGANQGLGTPRYGYVRLTFSDRIDACFVEVVPPGYDGTTDDPPRMGYCP
ncbi:MAG: metallophosphoesterase [Nannocystaceae bacterium]|nr:metallophosphoesterase [Nannocystaceae bacterium]